MGAIVGAELCQDAAHAGLGGFLCDGQLPGEYFVRLACRDERKDFDLALRERIVLHSRHDLFGNLTVDTLGASVNHADRLKELFPYATLTKNKTKLGRELRGRPYPTSRRRVRSFRLMR